MFLYIILECVLQMNGERTVSGIFHLLKGKRSSQTLQDARSYKLDQYFGIYPSLSKQVLQAFIKRAANEQLISIENEQFAVFREKGSDYLSNYKGPFPKYFSGMAEHGNVRDFQDRLQLHIQTVTHMSVNNPAFLPIIEQLKVQQWVKQQFSLNKARIKDVEVQLYLELATLLNQLTCLEAELFTSRLTGESVVGETRDQIAQDHNISIQDVDVLLSHVFYFLYHQAKNSPSHYPELARCLEGLSSSSLITQSAKITYRYLQRGFSIKDIARKRQLKISTIEDHVVEAALVVPHFSIRTFISEVDERRIVDAARALQTKRLKKIYESLEGEFTYFELRLVLAKEQHAQKEPTSYATS
ncbi:helix-turn-helix domain-containing protein [Halobacillus shinanisalinarum]|uniref:Helix-turn-helix domain-containing protein n=1 Tax=Halobacillus shinanisalinarum TaxID=2932258 RepID=A0ABY4H0D0_9BACI|nr:helix-turn-helix domain-containing protein [Halobacillus shinanisalinarum]UOQ93614.1 helix-turn-helix domain-containing protein [Halobacillus shinanisalinarum]